MQIMPSKANGILKVNAELFGGKNTKNLKNGQIEFGGDCGRP